MKICAECRWHVPCYVMGARHPRYDECARPENGERCAVTGGAFAADRGSCIIERDSDRRCGPEGKHWEPKPPKAPGVIASAVTSLCNWLGWVR